ncbi:uncharacterized protein [Setaria viridis]|uniref:uncharacterized protein n=1 Tax=Setaria viridis TaxID=4556 RepID=UPI003B3BB5EB
MILPDWTRMDYVVKSWIYGTVSPDLAKIFLSNRETRALYLDALFCNFVQGDLSIADYYCRFKSMADALNDLVEIVSDRTLVLNVIHGLNNHFLDIGKHIRCGRPFPTFLAACSELLMEELIMAHRSSAPSTALLTGTKPGAPSEQRLPAPTSSGGSGSGGASSKPPKSKSCRSKRGGHGSTDGS